jgi:hypothetical protein
MFSTVTTAKIPRIPMTTTTITLWTRATRVEPATLRSVIAMTSTTANAWTANDPPPIAELA